VTVVAVAARAIANVADPLLPAWFASPAYEALAVAVPTSVFAEYVGVSGALRPPAPDADAVQGVRGAPVYTTDVGQLTAVAEADGVIEKVFESLLPR
jgi:hypothetical protein